MFAVTNVVETPYDVQVNTARSSDGQVVVTAGDTFEVIVINLSNLAVEYRVGAGQWFRLPARKSRRIQVNLSFQVLRLRKGADVTGDLAVQVVTLSNRGEFPPVPGEGLRQFRQGGRTVLFGSSTMEKHWEHTGAGGIGRTALSAKGPFTWVNAMLGNRFQMVKNLGVGGQTAAQIYARVADVLAQHPDVVWYHAGSNDIFSGGATAEATFAYAKQTIDALLAAGIRVIVCLPQKWNSSDTEFTTAKVVQYFKYTEALALYGAAKNGVLVVNFSGPVTDVTSTAGNQLSNHFEDTKHLSNLGAYKIAKAIKDQVDDFSKHILLNQDEQVNLIADPFMTSTKAATAPVTGTIWNSFNVTRGAGTPAVACSVVGAPDGRGFAQRIQVTGNAANDRVNVDVPTATAWPLVSIGDTVQYELDVYVASSTALRALPAYLGLTRSSGGNWNVIGLGRDLITAGNDKALPDEPIRVTIQTPPYKLGSTVTGMSLSFSLLFNAAGAADVYVWNPRLRKVPSATLAY